MQKVETVLEPMIKATIIAPEEFTGAIINLCTVRLFFRSRCATSEREFRLMGI